MAQQGGLGRGLASLIPQKKINKNKIKQSSTGNIKSTKVGVKSKLFKADYFAKNNSVGEANYFGDAGKNKFSKNNQNRSQNKPLKDLSLKSVMKIGVDEVVPNPYQPRIDFDQVKLQELADSIAEHGIIQPLIVSYGKSGGYELIAGERRLEAAKLANLEKVPVIVRNVTDQNKAEWALIENIQRHNLNPIEEAQAYQRIQDEFNLTQDKISKKVGKSRSAVANILRLLKLPEEIKKALVAGKITEGHARTILVMDSFEKQMELFKSILKDGLNVRQVEGVTKGISVSKNYRVKKDVDPDLLDIENKIADNLNTKVKIRGIKDNGKILIDYYSEEELGEIVSKLRGE